MAKHKRKKPGAPPGQLIFTGQKYLETPLFISLRYDATGWQGDSDINTVFKDRDQNQIHWFDLRGIHDKALIEEIGSKFNIHPLALEDVLDPRQRPKFEEYDNGFFIIAKALSFNQEACKLETEQLSIFLGDNYLWSFQEKPTDLFTSIRDRVKKEDTRIRRRGADYLAYALLDVVVDHYFIVLDEIEKAIERIEENILKDPSNNTKAEIHQLKLQGVWMRKSVSPLREAISQFSKSERDLLKQETLIFIRDLYDHTIQVLDLTETYRDVISGLYDLYQSELSMKMNNIMQTLTIISTIFIPLGFLAGVYGMNFEKMPELSNPNGYFYWWLGVTLLVIIMLLFFRKRKWL